ncbi:MAG: DUF1272 domain-containing protein, partial [Variovorax sp.]
MLEMRPDCEHCRKALPHDAADARICSYECTFCADCANDVLHGICPNCGGGLANSIASPRPTAIASVGVRLSGLIPLPTSWPGPAWVVLVGQPGE